MGVKQYRSARTRRRYEGLEEDVVEGREHETRISTNCISKSPSPRLSSRSEGPPRLPERPSSRLLPRPVK
jgi:hypothetical protein